MDLCRFIIVDQRLTWRGCPGIGIIVYQIQIKTKSFISREGKGRIEDILIFNFTEYFSKRSRGISGSFVNKKTEFLFKYSSSIFFCKVLSKLNHRFKSVSVFNILGCYCASGFVRDVSGVSTSFGSCISLAACPPLQNSQIFNPPAIANDDGQTWNDQLNLIDFNDLLPSTDCLKEPARGRTFYVQDQFCFSIFRAIRGNEMFSRAGCKILYDLLNLTK